MYIIRVKLTILVAKNKEKEKIGWVDQSTRLIIQQSYAYEKNYNLEENVII